MYQSLNYLVSSYYLSPQARLDAACEHMEIGDVAEDERLELIVALTKRCWYTQGDHDVVGELRHSLAHQVTDLTRQLTILEDENALLHNIGLSADNVGLGLFVDSEIVLSTSYGKTRVFINKNLINRDLLSTWLIRGKVGPGMWCVKFNSTSNVLVCVTKRKVNMYGCVSE